MSTLELDGGLVLEVDEDGFIEDASIWNEDIARALAKIEEIELAEKHWEVIWYLRDYYAKFGIAPMVRKLYKDTGYKSKEIYEMFPSGPGRGACKIAGLPKPTGCV